MRLSLAPLALGPLALATGACMTTTPPTGGLEAPSAPPASCNATEAQQFIGRKATSSIGESVLKMTSSRTLRWGGPDSVFTMDFREDRVNVLYDSEGVITRIYCG